MKETKYTKIEIYFFKRYFCYSGLFFLISSNDSLRQKLIIRSSTFSYFINSKEIWFIQYIIMKINFQV